MENKVDKKNILITLDKYVEEYVRLNTKFSIGDIILFYPFSIIEKTYSKEPFIAIVNNCFNDLPISVLLCDDIDSGKLIKTYEDFNGEISVGYVLMDISFLSHVDAALFDYGMVKLPCFKINEELGMIAICVLKEKK
jgi:hypothetical protein